MKYQLFGGSDDPQGGILDLVGTFNELDQAEVAFIAFVDKTPSASWGHIWDLQTQKKVICWDKLVIKPKVTSSSIQIDSRLLPGHYGDRWWKRS